MAAVPEEKRRKSNIHADLLFLFLCAGLRTIKSLERAHRSKHDVEEEENYKKELDAPVMLEFELIVARSPAVREVNHIITQATAPCLPLELAASCHARQLAAPLLRLPLELAASLCVPLLLAIDAERWSFSEMNR